MTLLVFPQNAAPHKNDLYAYGWSNGMMADSYINLGDYTSAMKYVTIVIKNIAAYFPDELYSGYAVIVPVYVALHEYDSAMYAARKSLELLKALPQFYDKDNDQANLPEARCTYF